MQSQHRRFLWQIYLLLKQAPLASVGERAELGLPGKGGLSDSGVPAGGATSLLSHGQSGHTGHILRTSQERASSGRRCQHRDGHEPQWVLGSNIWGMRSPGCCAAREHRRGHWQGEQTWWSEEGEEGKATLLAVSVCSWRLFSISLCLLQELLWQRGNAGRVGLTPSLQSLWLLCMDSVHLSLFMEIVHVSQRRKNLYSSHLPEKANSHQENPLSCTAWHYSKES